MTSFAFTAFLLLLVLFALPSSSASSRAGPTGRGGAGWPSGFSSSGGSWASWRGLGPWASSSSPWASPGGTPPPGGLEGPEVLQKKPAHLRGKPLQNLPEGLRRLLGQGLQGLGGLFREDQEGELVEALGVGGGAVLKEGVGGGTSSQRRRAPATSPGRRAFRSRARARGCQR